MKIALNAAVAIYMGMNSEKNCARNFELRMQLIFAQTDAISIQGTATSSNWKRKIIVIERNSVEPRKNKAGIYPGGQSEEQLE